MGRRIRARAMAHCKNIKPNPTGWLPNARVRLVCRLSSIAGSLNRRLFAAYFKHATRRPNPFARRLTRCSFIPHTRTRRNRRPTLRDMSQIPQKLCKCDRDRRHKARSPKSGTLCWRAACDRTCAHTHTRTHIRHSQTKPFGVELCPTNSSTNARASRSERR